MRPWSPSSRHLLFEHPLLSLERQRVEAAPDDSKEVLVLRAPEWVNVVPITASGEVVMVRQWRFGVGAPTLEIPGGVVEGEGSREAAERELFEETGYRAERWELLGTVSPNPAILDNRCATWLAEDLTWVQQPTGDGDEELLVELVPLESVPALVREGVVDHALVVAAFHLFHLRDGWPCR